ncbi:putative Ribosomal RNA-processing protein 9 [Seiridium cardinale]|uniref:Ribosomal RNA-processing protein 9 n=1 Tax=Seiridium cardinale TaxID=138064 RepID=A0ABR2X5K9_9PEZI
MSSFFTVPGAHQKRKRPASDGPQKRFKPTSDGPQKRFKPTPGKATKTPKAPPRRQERDESISGSDSEDEDMGDDGEAEASETDSENEGESAAAKRLRLAEGYLERLRQEEEVTVGFDAVDVDKDLIADRLKADVSESKGKAFKQVADQLALDKASHCLFRTDTFTTTSIATSGSFCYTASSDRTIVKWRLQDLRNQYPQTTKRKPKKQAPLKKKPEKIAILKPGKTIDKTWQGHIAGSILCIAASQDGKFLVTGGTDRRLCVYDAHSLKPIKAWLHHRDSILALAFRRGSNQLYSGSADRTIKVWNLDDMAYIETLFGHADQVADIDALALERCVSVGARDKTARLWKIVDESQLVFRGGGSFDKKRLPNVDPRSIASEGSMDRIAMIDEELFVTGSDNGSISLWSISKKKPLFIMPQAHGLEPRLKAADLSAEVHPDPKIVPPPQPNWITALEVLPYSDVILSGSCDGLLKIWKLSEDRRSIIPIGALCESSSRDSPEFNGVSEDSQNPNKSNGIASESWKVKGFINDISVFERGDRGKDGLCVVAAIGKQHRLGNWKKIKGGRNGAVVFEVPRIEKQALVNGSAGSA